MATFASQVTESKLNDFVMFALQKRPSKIVDQVSVAHPILATLKSKGRIRREAPGQGPVRGLRFKIPDRTTVMSKSNGFVQRNLKVSEGLTQAQYHWLMLETDLVIPQWMYKNAVDAVGMVKYLSDQKDVTEKGQVVKLVNMLREGYSSGSEYVNGLNEANSFTPASDPARGAIGGISKADIPEWRNSVYNYNAEYKTVDTDGRLNTFLSGGSNSLRAACRTLSQAVTGDVNQLKTRITGSGPDLILVNDVADDMIADILENRLILQNAKKTEELGVDAFSYKGATIVHDPDVPDDPNNSTYGVLELWNTDSFDLTYAEGLEESFGPLEKLQESTGWYCSMMTQFSICYNDLRRNGKLYGLKPLA